MKAIDPNSVMSRSTLTSTGKKSIKTVDATSTMTASLNDTMSQLKLMVSMLELTTALTSLCEKVKQKESLSPGTPIASQPAKAADAGSSEAAPAQQAAPASATASSSAADGGSASPAPVTPSQAAAGSEPTTAPVKGSSSGGTVLDQINNIEAGRQAAKKDPSIQSASSIADTKSAMAASGASSGPITAFSPTVNDALNKAAAANGVPAKLLAAVCKQESGGNPNAVSPDGHDVGLMQLRDNTAPSLGCRNSDRKDPYKSADAGAKYLKQMLNRFGDMRTALGGYNQGAGRARSANGQRYADQVLARMNKIK